MAPELIITFTFFLFHSSTSWSQPNPGARITAMGQTTATAVGLPAIYGNPAGIITAVQHFAFLGYATSPLTPEITIQSVALLFPAGRNSLGIGLQRYGLPEFYTLSAGFVYGKRFGERTGIGVRLNYQQINAVNYGALSNFYIDTGIIMALSPKVFLGAYISNPSQKYNNNNNNKIEYNIPLLIGFGVSWAATDQVILTAMLEKEHHMRSDLKGGLEYKPDERFSLRGGMALHPIRHFAGFGFSYRQMILDFAVASNIYTGYQPQLNISYAW